MYGGFNLKSNYFRWRLTPELTIAFGMNFMAPGTESVAESAEVIGSRHPGVQDMDAYERVLTDAMRGDATLFARQDYVEEAWRVVDPALRAGTPIFEYEPKTWGPKEVEQVTPPHGWHNSVVKTLEVVSKKEAPRTRKAG
jgi:glucose-6-phosphate 1-dehydrogenase